MLPSISSLRAIHALRPCIHLRTLATQTTTLPLTTDSSHVVIEIASSKPTTPKPKSLTALSGAEQGALRPHLNIPVDPKHGLWAFFRKVSKEDGRVEHESMEDVRQYFQSNSGRSWRAEELRRKSFKDLHTLWYVLLREQNLIATQKEEARRMGAPMDYFPTMRKKMQCRKSMARIKGVLNERRLAYEGAVKIFTERQQALLAEAHAEEEAKIKAEERKLKEAEKEKEDAERKARAIPAEVKLAEQGLFASVQQQTVKP